MTSAQETDTPQLPVSRIQVVSSAADIGIGRSRGRSGEIICIMRTVVVGKEYTVTMTKSIREVCGLWDDINPILANTRGTILASGLDAVFRI